MIKINCLAYSLVNCLGTPYKSGVNTSIQQLHRNYTESIRTN